MSNLPRDGCTIAERDDTDLHMNFCFCRALPDGDVDCLRQKDVTCTRIKNGTVQTLTLATYPSSLQYALLQHASPTT